MRSLGIASLESAKVFRLSGGERQRIGVAQVMAGRATLVLADEPTASLDSDSRRMVCNGLRALADREALVFVATHDPYVADQADQTIVLPQRGSGANL